jgi:deoxyribodipyrimidine photolyase-related protein
MRTTLLIFPHQLFAHNPGLDEKPDEIVLIEDSLFFGDPQYPMRFHKQKLWLHRTSMTRYQATLEGKDLNVSLRRHASGKIVLKRLVKNLAEDGVERIICCDPVDFILEKRLRHYAAENDLKLDLLPTPMFLNLKSTNEDWRAEQNKWFMASFYKFQRRRFDVLMDGDEPEGGQWSFDEDNRKKVPKKLLGEAPRLKPYGADEIAEQARQSVEDEFTDNYGTLENLYWPTTHDAAARWLDRFLEDRFERFGPYEDAVIEGKSLLWHSALTPMLNIGLLTPQQILDRTLDYISDNDVPINSVEGFIRQIIGWREFMRATYDDLGVSMRTTNHWNHTRKIPESFWTGETGIKPLDDIIRRVRDTGYANHIERLMFLGGFMFLCEFDPDEIYRWFMEMFVDAYDWVMVPNAYAMSQNADGGQITTKPYFSGSNYVKKMSNWPGNEDWAEIWDALYWRWIWQHADELGKNPRWAMMVSTAKRMNEDKREAHLNRAASFLRQLTIEANED